MSAAFFIKIEQTNAFLVQGQIGLAQSILSELEAKNAVENRWRDHYLGLIKMRQGSFEQAITIFTNTLGKNGYHLSVILDLATCFYVTGQMYNWQKMVDLALTEYSKSHEKFSLHKKVQNGITLAKFIEEKGLVAEALDLYTDLLKLELETADFVKVSAQIVRLHGQYSLKMDISEDYQKLCALTANSSEWEHDLNIQQALMTYELSQFGSVVCWTRYKRLTQNSMVQSFEMDQIQTELFYGFLASGHKDQALQLLTHVATPLNIFTSSLRQILQTQDLGLEKYMECITRITPAAHLRLLKIWNLCSENTMLERRQKLLIDLYSKKTKMLWARYLNLPAVAVAVAVAETAIESKSDTVSLNLSADILKASTNNMKIKLSKNSSEIMALFANPNANPNGKANQILLADVFKLETASDFSRLRLRVSRLNNLLHAKLGLINCLHLDKTHLKINYMISKD